MGSLRTIFGRSSDDLRKNTGKMQGISIFNPQKNNHQTMRTFRNASAVCQFVVTITSGIGVFAWAHGLAWKYLPADLWLSPYVAFLAGALAGYFAGYITDIGFGRILQDVLFRSLAGRHPNIRKHNGDGYFSKFQALETWMKWGLLVLLLTMDVLSMYVITDPVTRAAGSDQTADVEAMRADLQSRYDAQVSDLRAQAKEKERAIKSERSRVAGANSALVRLQSSGNGWAAGEIAKKQNAATRSDRDAKAALESAVQQKLSEGQQYIKDRVAEAEKHNRETDERNRTNQSIAATMYLIFTIGLKFLTIFLRVLIVVSFVAYSYDYSPDITGDSVIDYRDAEAYARKGNFQSARQR